MGDRPPQSSSESTADIITALATYLPSYMASQNSQVLPQAQAELNAAQQISPAYNQLLTDLYSQNAPQLAKIGSQVEGINRLGAANTDLAILSGAGGDLAKKAVEIDKQLNPEFYSTRAAEADQLGKLLSSYNNPNTEAERLVGQENYRTGNLNNTSQTNTVKNALQFGNENEKRRQSLTQALGVATQFLQPSQGQFNPVVTALNRPSTNTGSNQFAGVQNPSNQAYQSGNALAGQIGSIVQQRNDLNANRRDALDRLNETTSAIGSVVSI